MKSHCTFLCVVLIAISCSRIKNKSDEADQWRQPSVPTASEAIIAKNFPGAVKAPEFGDSMIRHITETFGILPNKMLLGASTCVDDIIYTKNFHVHTEIKGPFHLGGLAGLPFTGISGLEALAHHIPDSGTMILMVEPHIGFSEKRGWGYVLRHEQHEPSTCCGALMGTLSKLQMGKLKPGSSEEDYQGDKIGELALQHEKEILTAENPIIELTKITSVEAERQIMSHVLKVDLEHIKYIVIISGVIIDTDYSYSDYQFVDHIMVYDVSKKTFVEDLRGPFNFSK